MTKLDRAVALQRLIDKSHADAMAHYAASAAECREWRREIDSLMTARPAEVHSGD